MAGFDNEVLFCPGERLEPSNAQSIALMQDGTATNISRINYVGNPEGNVAANPSSICHDPVSGYFYLKISGTGTTLWERITTISNVVTYGTFTPILSFGGGTTGITYASRSGTYQRVGNIVFYNAYCLLTSKGSSTGGAKITGLPISCAEPINGILGMADASVPAGIFQISTFFFAGIPEIILVAADSTTIPNTYPLIDDTYFNNNTVVRCYGYYIA
jgi:hypothetical protein